MTFGPEIIPQSGARSSVADTAGGDAGQLLHGGAGARIYLANCDQAVIEKIHTTICVG